MARRRSDHNKREPDVSIEFDNDSGAPRKARQAVRPLISALNDPVADAVETVTSELVSNVVEHTADGGTVKAWDPKPDVPLRVEVADRDPAEPTPQDVATDAGGRGLRIVEQLADEWGVKRDDVGKTVWAEFDRDAH